MTRITLSIETRGAAKGRREYGRVYCGTVAVVGAHAVIDASSAPLPSVFKSLLRRIVIAPVLVMLGV